MKAEKSKEEKQEQYNRCRRLGDIFINFKNIGQEIDQWKAEHKNQGSCFKVDHCQDKQGQTEREKYQLEGPDKGDILHIKKIKSDPACNCCEQEQYSLEGAVFHVSILNC